MRDRLNKLESKDKLLIYKFLYKNEGDFYTQDEIFSDEEYEYLKSSVDPNSWEYQLPWDEVEYRHVEKLLEVAGVRKNHLSGTNTTKLEEGKEKLISNWSKPRSIQMVETGVEIKTYFDENKDIIIKGNYNFIAQLKLDGWHIQLYYTQKSEYPELVTTRGRGGNTVDCTEVLAELMPPLSVEDPVLISGELVLDKRILTELRVKYGRPFKNSRNSISSIIYNTINVEEIRDHIRVYAFDLQFEGGLRYPDRILTFEALESVGFKTPPRLLVKEFETDFYPAFRQLQEFYSKTFKENWECDGVVLVPVRYCSEGSVGDSNYQDRAIAIKMGIWSKKFYHATVEEIICPPSSGGSYRELTALISPTETIDGRIIKRVPLINLRRAKCGKEVSPVDIGDEIIFSYHSKQIVKFRGKEGIIYF